MAKDIAILAEDDYEDLELWYPLLRLREEGFNVTVIGVDCDVYYSKHGYEVVADVAIDEVDPEKYEGVIVPGGWAPDRLRRYPAVNDFVRKLFDNGKLVASICHGGSVLISAGILRGKRATAVMAIKDDMINAGARFIDTEVICDGNLITSRTPADLPAFMREIIKALKK
ncbi:MAG TPA: type 1 glutamine amidotransferase domain-containing protein [Methanomassiliicoccales archaeon]|nr:type 1 glutamine amidotransferase domain-containing protein [Methanomassiliicoccales archaeon]